MLNNLLLFFSFISLLGLFPNDFFCTVHSEYAPQLDIYNNPVHCKQTMKHYFSTCVEHYDQHFHCTKIVGTSLCYSEDAHVYVNMNITGI